MAAVGSGRDAGGDKLTAEQIALINDGFAPYAPRWGGTGYATQDAWQKEVGKKAQAVKHANRIAGTYWSVVTAGGEPVVGPRKTLEGALAAFRQLPEAERKPAV